VYALCNVHALRIRLIELNDDLHNIVHRSPQSKILATPMHQSVAQGVKSAIYDFLVSLKVINYPLIGVLRVT